MKITFNSYSDKFRLQNALIFARHSTDTIAKMREVSEHAANQMLRENKEWNDMYHALQADGLEFEL
jgi:hypothetical protein